MSTKMTDIREKPTRMQDGIADAIASRDSLQDVLHKTWEIIQRGQLFLWEGGSRSAG